MYEKLGIVTNIWAKRMESGDSFEDLASQFGENGFREMEVRDHNYLRNSEFGEMMREIEAAMDAYTDEGWKAICESLWRDAQWSELIKVEHKSLFDKVSEFQRKMSDLTLSYAASHVWLAEPDDLHADNKRIIEAKKFAYLLCPHAARFRIVDVETDGEHRHRCCSNQCSATQVFAAFVSHGFCCRAWTSVSHLDVGDWQNTAVAH